MSVPNRAEESSTAGAGDEARKGVTEPEAGVEPPMPAAGAQGRAEPPMPTAGAEAGPLAGTRVLDFSQNLAGPFAAQILGDLGADVVKVEPPGGDPAREWGPPFVGGQSTLFQVVNRNKRSVVLDLKDRRDRDRALRLAAEADVVIQALRHGAADRLGIGHERVKGDNPSVIYVSVTAYGDEGPLRDEPGYDPLMQARSGLMAVTGDPGGKPARVGTSIVDLGTGMWTAIAVMAALMERRRTGRGCHVTTSLLDTSLAWMSYHLTGYLATGILPEPMGSSIGMIAPYQAFPCTDGSVMIAAGNDDIFRRLCDALGLALAGHPDYADNASRVANSARLARTVAERTREHTVRDLLKLLSDHRVPAAPIQTVASALEDPQTAATGMIQPCDHPRAEGYVDVPMPVRWDGRRPALRRVPPDIGEHQGELFPDDETLWP